MRRAWQNEENACAEDAKSPRRTLERKRLLEIVHPNKRPQPVAPDNPKAFSKIIARSPKTTRVLREAELPAASDVPIPINGESGTGKELPARAVHEAASRSKTPFVAVNMASPTAGLFEAEFFGHAKGAFTGANRERAGFSKTADRGALFPEDIGNPSMELQSKLPRVLQDGEFSRPGESRTRRVDVRVVAAANEDLEKLVVGRTS